MPKINSKSPISFFIKALREARPSPGGGAVAALVGALGMALVIKAANFTIGKKRYKKHEPEVRSILKKANRLKDKLNSLIEKDAKTYSEYSKTKTVAALKKATSCVGEISGASKEGLKFCGRMERIGNVNLKSDLYAAKLFLNSSMRAADNFVKLNKKHMER